MKEESNVLYEIKGEIEKINGAYEVKCPNCNKKFFLRINEEFAIDNWDKIKIICPHCKKIIK